MEFERDCFQSHDQFVGWYFVFCFLLCRWFGCYLVIIIWKEHTTPNVKFGLIDGWIKVILRVQILKPASIKFGSQLQDFDKNAAISRWYGYLILISTQGLCASSSRPILCQVLIPHQSQFSGLYIQFDVTKKKKKIIGFQPKVEFYAQRQPPKKHACMETLQEAQALSLRKISAAPLMGPAQGWRTIPKCPTMKRFRHGLEEYKISCPTNHSNPFSIIV